MRSATTGNGLKIFPLSRQYFLAAGAAICVGCSFPLAPGHAQAGQFETLGKPVKTVMLTATIVGPDEKGEDVIYFDCAQPGNRLFLLQVNPRTDVVRQWGAPVGEGAWAMIEGPDRCIYLGTWESGYLLKFDPKHPEKGLESLGKPSETETYVWQLALGADNRLYGCTYPQAKLVSYDPKSGETKDLGRLDPKEMYSRSVAASTNGSIYVGIGTVRAQVVRYDPATGQTRAMVKEEERPAGSAAVFRATDGQVYASVGGKYFRCEPDRLEPVDAPGTQARTTLKDGRVVANAAVDHERIVYELQPAKGEPVRKSAKFEGAGIRVFVVGAGPGGRIFGSTALPLEMFEFNPITSALKDLGNPTDVGGEIYSFANDGKRLYLCAYPQSFLSIYEPDKPWQYGKTKESNPRGFGYMGEGHLRPRAMALGPDGRVYVGSLPPYGQTGGSLGVYDPEADKVVENYRHLVTNQGISALCFETETKRLFAGSSVAAGGGGVVMARECVVLAWDTKARRKDWEEAVVSGDTTVAALAACHGKVFAVTVPSGTLTVIDGKTLKKVSQAKIPFGHLHEISLGYYEPHDRIYGLAGQSVFSIDPGSFKMSETARSPEPITCGFALTETGIYFGSGTQLMRWRWE